jgi:DNA-binding response OmpR family regulator
MLIPRCSSPPPALQTGSEGLEHFDPSKGLENMPDLVLLDCMLPDTTGINICRLVRKRFSKHALPIIMVSARAQDTAIAEALQAGANDYVIKPFRRGEMMARIRAHLRARTAGLAAPNRAGSTSGSEAGGLEGLRRANTHGSGYLSQLSKALAGQDGSYLDPQRLASPLGGSPLQL